MTLGNATDAKVALRRYKDECEGRLNQVPHPYPEKGWRRIGAGSTRTAYLSPARVVYKVGDDYINQIEAKRARLARSSKKLADLGVKVPRTRLHHVQGRSVMAMEYVPSAKVADCSSLSTYSYNCDCKPGKKRLCWSVLYGRLGDLGFYDMWEANVRLTPDNEIYLIDLGE